MQVFGFYAVFVFAVRSWIIGRKWVFLQENSKTEERWKQHYH